MSKVGKTKNSIKETQLSIPDLAKSKKFIFEGEMSKMHKVGENPQQSDEIMKAHLARTGKNVITRFAPEPNGFLHIGHAKAMNINFGFSTAYNGKTNLRYDDTNPEAEQEIYFTAIKDMVEWLGFIPSQTTYSSDNFQKLYELAVDLIKRDKAYMCYCTGSEIYQQRGGETNGPRTTCLHRTRHVTESLVEFKKMKDGHFKQGEATLRMKMDMENPNPQFWDLIAYRVLNIPHIRTGTDWKIYPTYDYSHCLCDSLEDITHSFCTTEFTLSRPSYYWLIDTLEQYKPVQWESGRLSIAHTVLSKRKLNTLVTKGYVYGWDDPRLYTLSALKRRGFTPESVNAFCRELGVTLANSIVLPSKLEYYVRDHLNFISPRLFLVLDPIKITLINLDINFLMNVIVQNKPHDESRGVRNMLFTQTVFIARDDFREVPDSNFYRLSLGNIVGLLNIPFPIRATKVIKNEAGVILEVLAEYLYNFTDKPKAFVQWVANSLKHESPVSIEVRVIDKLFLHQNPDNKKECPDGWLSDLNPNSLQIVDGFIELEAKTFKIGNKFQGVRTGYYCIDPDTTDKKLIVNQIVSLKVKKNDNLLN